MSHASLMFQEASETPEVLSLQRQENLTKCVEIAEYFRDNPPNIIFMIGRGTSDHAGVYAKYLFEVGLGIPVCAAAPSVAGVFDCRLTLSNSLAIVISQSGQSPDIVKQTEYAKQGGAKTLAIVNDTQSPVARCADFVLPLHAGKEKAVAATKSYLASLHALCQLYATWKEDEGLTNTLEGLPNAMQQAKETSPKLLPQDLEGIRHCVVLGRGFGYAVAREVALKLKEVLGIHAESYSSAEFLHGPVTLAHNGLLVIDITLQDETYEMHSSQIKDIKARGAKVKDISLDRTIHPRLDALLVMQRFYLDIEAVAVASGNNPDEPVGLKKVTETV